MTQIQLTDEQVRDAVKSTAQEIIDDLASDTDRETLIDRMDEECDTLWSQLVQHGRIDQYDSDDLVRCAGACGTIITVAEADAWVETDTGLWEGLTYGVVPSIAYFSLRNLLYSALKDAGVDSNDDEPLANVKSASAE